MFQTARLTCALALGACALFAQTNIPAVQLETTAMVGIAAGQTANLNLLNPGAQPPVVSPAVGVVCTATVQYLDNTGAVLKTGTVTVNPGASGSFELHSDTDLSLVSNERREIRATISIPLVPPPPTAAAGTAATPACKLISNIEIFDTLTGRTDALVGHVETVN